MVVEVSGGQEERTRSWDLISLPAIRTRQHLPVRFHDQNSLPAGDSACPMSGAGFRSRKQRPVMLIYSLKIEDFTSATYTTGGRKRTEGEP
jgi:hypothetical protein